MSNSRSIGLVYHRRLAEKFVHWSLVLCLVGLAGGNCISCRRISAERLVRGVVQHEANSQDVRLSAISEARRRHHGCWRIGDWLETRLSLSFRVLCVRIICKPTGASIVETSRTVGKQTAAETGSSCARRLFVQGFSKVQPFARRSCFQRIVFSDCELLNLVGAEREFCCFPVVQRRNVAIDGT